MDRLTLDARTLLVAARAVGLVVAASGDRLVVRGRKGAAGLARLVLDYKPGILAALAVESSPAGLAALERVPWPPWGVTAWPPEESSALPSPAPAGPPEGPAAAPEAAAPSPPPWPPRAADWAAVLWERANRRYDPPLWFEGRVGEHRPCE